MFIIIKLSSSIMMQISDAIETGVSLLLKITAMLLADNRLVDCYHMWAAVVDFSHLISLNIRTTLSPRTIN